MEMTDQPIQPRGRIRDAVRNARTTLDSANEAAKRVEETANWIAVTLALVAVVSIAALGLAVIALIGARKGGSDAE